uniref:Cyclin-like domain-containing protein n=1 Tax=Cairina moschata TaxID=8855 RepID=A0A8C3BXQ2_CAIMO
AGGRWGEPGLGEVGSGEQGAGGGGGRAEGSWGEADSGGGEAGAGVGRVGGGWGEPGESVLKGRGDGFGAGRARQRSREKLRGAGPGVGRVGGHWGGDSTREGRAWPWNGGVKAWFWGQQELGKPVPATGESGSTLGEPGLVLGGRVHLSSRAWGRGLGPAWCFGAGGVPRGVVPFLSPATSSQLTINTAIVYMHRFYMVQSFTQFHRNSVAPAALFLAAKVEEQPHKLEHVIKVAHACLHPQEPPPDTRSEAYLQQAQDLVILESIILQTLGFEITIDHPHTHVVKCTQLVRASKDLAQTSYFMATNSFRQIPSCGDRKRCVSGKELAEMKSWEEKAGLGVGSASVCPTCCLESFVVHKTPNEEAKTAEIFAQT